VTVVNSVMSLFCDGNDQFSEVFYRTWLCFLAGHSRLHEKLNAEACDKLMISIIVQETINRLTD